MHVEQGRGREGGEGGEEPRDENPPVMECHRVIYTHTCLGFCA